MRSRYMLTQPGDVAATVAQDTTVGADDYRSGAVVGLFDVVLYDDAGDSKRALVELLLAEANAWRAMSEALDANTGKGEIHLSAADVCAVGFEQQEQIAKRGEQ